MRKPSELDTPTISTRGAKKKRWRGFSPDEPSESSGYHQTEHPNTMPSSECCPGSPSMRWEILALYASSSFSVMVATSPAMSLNFLTADLPPIDLIGRHQPIKISDCVLTENWGGH